MAEETRPHRALYQCRGARRRSPRVQQVRADDLRPVGFDAGLLTLPAQKARLPGNVVLPGTTPTRQQRPVLLATAEAFGRVAESFLLG